MEKKILFILFPLWTICSIYSLYLRIGYWAILIDLIMIVAFSFFSYNISTIKNKVPLIIKKITKKIFKNKFLRYIYYLILLYLLFFQPGFMSDIMLISLNFINMFGISILIIILLNWITNLRAKM